MAKHFHGPRRALRGPARPRLQASEAPGKKDMPQQSPPLWARGLPVHVAKWAVECGIDSDSDLAGFFDSTQDVQEFIEAKGWSAQSAEACVLAWSEASHRAGRLLAAGGQWTAPAGRTAEEQAASSTSVPAGLAPAARRARFVEVDVPAAEVTNKMVVKELAKRDVHLETLKVLWQRAGGRGLYWQSGTPEEVETRWKYLVRAGRRLTLATVARHVTAWQAWEKWVTNHYKDGAAVVIFDPAPVDVAAFLDAETRRGPTLGRSRLQSFGWLRQRLGLNLPIKDALLADFVNHPQEHEARQAEVISPSALVNLIGQIKRLGPKRSQEPQIVLFLALACVRHKHLSISTITGATADYVFGNCPVGKARRKGRRPSFDWAVPRPGGVDQAFSFLLELAEKLKNPPFVVPARAKTRRMPTRKWLKEPMSYQMAVRIIRQCMVDSGVPSSRAGVLTYNSCRRFMPTLGGILGASRHEAQAIGNWVEEETPGGSHSREAGASVMPMGVHYCDQKALTSGMVKTGVLAKFFKLLETLPKVQAILHGDPGVLLEDELSWEILAGLVQDKNQLKQQPATDELGKKNKKDKKKAKSQKKDTEEIDAKVVKHKRVRLDTRPSYRDRLR